jgi:hypothetical protein
MTITDDTQRDAHQNKTEAEGRGATAKPPRAFRRWIDKIISKWREASFLKMLIVVVLLTLLCFMGSSAQIYYIHTQIEKEHKPDIKGALSQLENVNGATISEKFQHARWKTLAALEANDIENEYHQANIFLLSRLWISYLGAITGMILALVGATFIITKLSEPPVAYDKGEDKPSAVLRASMVSVSPGLILALIGTTLILTSLFVNYPMTFSTSSKYIKEWPAPPRETSTPTPATATAATAQPTPTPVVGAAR